MRILLMDENSQIGGAQVVMLQIAGHLRERGVPTGAMIQGPGRLEHQLILSEVAIEHHDFQGLKKRWFLPWALRSNHRKMVVAIERFRPDLIVCNSPWTAVCAVSAIRARRIRSVVVVHASIAPGRAVKKILIPMVFRRITPVINLWVAVSEALCEQVRGLGAASCTVIRNGVDIRRFRPGGTGLLRSACGLSDHAFLAVTAGRLHPGKGQQDLINAAVTLIRSHPEFHLAIIGSELLNPNEAPGFRMELERLAQESGIGAHIHFLDFRSDLHQLLPDADCMLSGSYEESFGLAILEGMSAGLPVVATDVPGHRGLIADDREGYLYQAGEITHLIKRLDHLIASRDTRERMSRAARERAEAFGLESTMSEWMKLFDSLGGIG